MEGGREDKTNPHCRRKTSVLPPLLLASSAIAVLLLSPSLSLSLSSLRSSYFIRSLSFLLLLLLSSYAHI
jgi:hypothetical protein